MASAGRTQRLFWGSLLLAAALWSLSIPLRCASRALLVGGVALLAGAGMGTALALVTRTRRPGAIYLFLALAALTLWPLQRNWPPGGAWDVDPWQGAPAILTNYFEIARLLFYLLGIPYPFARLGHHAPDPIAAGTDLAENESGE